MNDHLRNNTTSVQIPFDPVEDVDDMNSPTAEIDLQVILSGDEMSQDTILLKFFFADMRKEKDVG